MRTPPPGPEMKPCSSYLLLKFVYLTGQRRHSLEMHPLLRKILGPPLLYDNNMYSLCFGLLSISHAYVHERNQ